MSTEPLNLNQEVSCHRCHWHGKLRQLKFSITRVPVILGSTVVSDAWDESHEPCCPACRSIHIIFKEDSND